MSNERDKGEAEAESNQESSKVGEVVDPRKKHTEEEEDARDSDSLAQSFDRMFNHIPTNDDLHNKVSKETKVRSCRTNFWFVR